MPIAFIHLGAQQAQPLQPYCSGNTAGDRQECQSCSPCSSPLALALVGNCFPGWQPGRKSTTNSSGGQARHPPWGGKEQCPRLPAALQERAPIPRAEGPGVAADPLPKPSPWLTGCFCLAEAVRLMPGQSVPFPPSGTSRPAGFSSYKASSQVLAAPSPRAAGSPCPAGAAGGQWWPAQSPRAARGEHSAPNTLRLLAPPSPSERFPNSPLRPNAAGIRGCLTWCIPQVFKKKNEKMYTTLQTSSKWAVVWIFFFLFLEGGNASCFHNAAS